MSAIRARLISYSGLITKHQLRLVLHNIRSAHNVGSILRSADGFAVSKVYFSGYTPHPKTQNDSRLPHVINRAEKQIAKTALGAEKAIAWEYVDSPMNLLERLNREGFEIVALEQT